MQTFVTEDEWEAAFKAAEVIVDGYLNGNFVMRNGQVSNLPYVLPSIRTKIAQDVATAVIRSSPRVEGDITDVWGVSVEDVRFQF